MKTSDHIDSINLEASWKAILAHELTKNYLRELWTFLIKEKQAGKTIYPPSSERFNAFNLTPFDQVKVIILGQDPYHGPGQAHGLCFSVRPTVKIPPSLRNIYKELQLDLQIPPASHGCLTHWAEQGVLLLNSVLTVEEGRAASHQGLGWERFTDQVIHTLNARKQHLVFLLWGNYAQQKGSFIDEHKHLVLRSAHPSPLSARKFLGNHHFSKTNAYLALHHQPPIEWQLPNYLPDPQFK